MVVSDANYRTVITVRQSREAVFGSDGQSVGMDTETEYKNGGKTNIPP